MPFNPLLLMPAGVVLLCACSRVSHFSSVNMPNGARFHGSVPRRRDLVTSLGLLSGPVFGSRPARSRENKRGVWPNVGARRTLLTIGRPARCDCCHLVPHCH